MLFLTLSPPPRDFVHQSAILNYSVRDRALLRRSGTIELAEFVYGATRHSLSELLRCWPQPIVPEPEPRILREFLPAGCGVQSRQWRLSAADIASVDQHADTCGAGSGRADSRTSDDRAPGGAACNAGY
jgi:hypothetical protein